MIVLITWTLFDMTEATRTIRLDGHVETRLKSYSPNKKIHLSRIAAWDFIRALHHFVQVVGIFNYKINNLKTLLVG